MSRKNKPLIKKVYLIKAYNGTATIRGIPCDVFLSCQYNPHTRQNYTAIHYFSSIFLNFILHPKVSL